MTSIWEVAASELVMKLALTDGKMKSHKSNLLSQRVFETSCTWRFLGCVNAASLTGMLKSYYASVLCYLMLVATGHVWLLITGNMVSPN